MPLNRREPFFSALQLRGSKSHVCACPKRNMIKLDTEKNKVENLLISFMLLRKRFKDNVSNEPDLAKVKQWMDSRFHVSKKCDVSAPCFKFKI